MHKTFALAIAGTLTLLSACKEKPQPSAPAVQPVGVVTLKAQAVTLTSDLPGRTSAYRVAEVRPQVSGVIQKRLFAEGADVEAGQPLFQIDPAPFRATRDSAAANLSHAQAAADFAHMQAERDKSLLEAQVLSRQDYDDAQAKAREADADIGTASAALETAMINLAYTRVTAPIAGRTGRSGVTEGALVTADQSAPIVVIQQYDPIYVDVTQPSSLLLRLQRELAAGELKKAENGQAQVRLKLEDGSAYAPAGALQFSEVSVDPGTGSVTLRALFPNPSRLLLPGMFVREVVEEGVRENGLLVPQQGVTHDPTGRFTALVAQADGTVALRTIETERAIGDQWLVSKGLAAGDRVIVEGLQKIKPGDHVDVAEAVLTHAADADGDTAAAADVR